jgi:hypothetical protein
MNPSRVPWRLLFLVPLLGLGVLPPAGAEQMALPVGRQVQLLFKILNYDRNLEKKAGPVLGIGIIYVGTDRDSRNATDELESALFKVKDIPVNKQGLPFKVYDREYTSKADLERFVKEKLISVLYVAPGNARNLDDIVQLSRELGLTTATGVPEYVKRGVSVGMTLAQDAPQILINLQSTRAEGSEFTASLLRYATIVQTR